MIAADETQALVFGVPFCALDRNDKLGRLRPYRRRMTPFRYAASE
jgi:hypothetical protein